MMLAGACAYAALIAGKSAATSARSAAVQNLAIGAPGRPLWTQTRGGFREAGGDPSHAAEDEARGPPSLIGRFQQNL